MAGRHTHAADVDDELAALATCHSFIIDLDDEGQGRVLRWLRERLEQERLDREDERNQEAAAATVVQYVDPIHPQGVGEP